MTSPDPREALTKWAGSTLSKEIEVNQGRVQHTGLETPASLRERLEPDAHTGAGIHRRPFAMEFKMCLHVVNSRSHLLLGCDPLNGAAWAHGNPTGEGLRVPQHWGRRAWYREISLYA